MQLRELLTEEVFSSLAVGYHRTRNLKNTNEIGESGFKAGSRAMYGKGIYLTYNFDDQQDERMKELYGPFIVRCKINLADFLIFDPDVAMRVYGNADPRKQLDHFGIGWSDPNAGETKRRTEEQWQDVVSLSLFAPREYTSAGAKQFADWLHKKQRRFKRPIKGLVFTGQQDGRVIVAYDPSPVIPFAWARVIDLNKTRETVRWNKIATPPITKSTESMPEYERAYRFFRENGFTLLSQGSKGAYMMGVRGGDFLSIVVTERAATSFGLDQGISVKSFCNRVDPVKINVPGYAERLGYPLIYEEFTGKLPLGKILNTILSTHDAMKERPAQHVAFTQGLLRHIMKPEVPIQTENKPGRDYRQDEIILQAESVTVKLDSPYREFTTGKVWIASKPMPTELGFNDGSPRGGEPTVAGAYKTLLHMIMFARRHYDGLTWPDDLQPQFVADLTAELAQH